MSIRRLNFQMPQLWQSDDALKVNLNVSSEIASLAADLDMQVFQNVCPWDSSWELDLQENKI